MSVNLIGGRQEATGTVTIQIPFIDLNLILGVRFLLLNEDVPTL